MTDQPASIITLSKQDLKDLAEFRQEEALLGKQILDLQEALNNTPEAQAVKAAVENRKAVCEKIAVLEAFIRKSALEDFINTKVKPVFEGITVKIFKRFSLDKSIAVPWAKEHEPELFKFDEKGFEKYARALLGTKEVPGATFEDDPRVEIASDLSAYL
jgi:hypothetical protein